MMFFLALCSLVCSMSTYAMLEGNITEKILQAAHNKNPQAIHTALASLQNLNTHLQIKHLNTIDEKQLEAFLDKHKKTSISHGKHMLATLLASIVPSACYGILAYTNPNATCTQAQNMLDAVEFSEYQCPAADQAMRLYYSCSDESFSYAYPLLGSLFLLGVTGALHEKNYVIESQTTQSIQNIVNYKKKLAVQNHTMVPLDEETPENN